MNVTPLLLLALRLLVFCVGVVLVSVCAVGMLFVLAGALCATACVRPACAVLACVGAGVRVVVVCAACCGTGVAVRVWVGAGVRGVVACVVWCGTGVAGVCGTAPPAALRCSSCSLSVFTHSACVNLRASLFMCDL